MSIQKSVNYDTHSEEISLFLKLQQKKLWFKMTQDLWQYQQVLSAFHTFHTFTSWDWWRELNHVSDENFNTCMNKCTMTQIDELHRWAVKHTILGIPPTMSDSQWSSVVRLLAGGAAISVFILPVSFQFTQTKPPCKLAGGRRPRLQIISIGERVHGRWSTTCI